MSDRPTIAEKYVKAAASSNLRHSDRPCDTDKLAAMAWSDKEFGGALFRLKYANDAGRYATALSKLEWVAGRDAAKKGIGLAEIGARWIAKTALDHWLFDICPACQGTGHQKTDPNTPKRDDEPCIACNGRGRRVLDCDPIIRPSVVELLSTIDRRVCDAGSEAIRLLAREMDGI